MLALNARRETFKGNARLCYCHRWVGWGNLSPPPHSSATAASEIYLFTFMLRHNDGLTNGQTNTYGLTETAFNCWSATSDYGYLTICHIKLLYICLFTNSGLLLVKNISNTIFTNKIFPHILTYISGYFGPILKNLVTK